MLLDPLLSQALHFASQRHAGQNWKGSKHPYFHHLLGVLDLLVRIGDLQDQTTLLAGILHDTLEDTTTTPLELKQFFGKEVAAVVLELSDNPAHTEAERWQAQIDHAPTLSPAAACVKIADKTANLRDLYELQIPWDKEKRLAYLDWGVRVVAGCRRANEALAAHFDQLVAEIKKLEGIA